MIKVKERKLAIFRNCFTKNNEEQLFLCRDVMVNRTIVLLITEIVKDFYEIVFYPAEVRSSMRHRGP